MPAQWGLVASFLALKSAGLRIDDAGHIDDAAFQVCCKEGGGLKMAS